jgi:hypothetical protein
MLATVPSGPRLFFFNIVVLQNVRLFIFCDMTVQCDREMTSHLLVIYRITLE